jgi:hypothetical protein
MVDKLLAGEPHKSYLSPDNFRREQIIVKGMDGACSIHKRHKKGIQNQFQLEVLDRRSHT